MTTTQDVESTLNFLAPNWTEYPFGTAIQVEIRVHKDDSGFVGRVTRLRDVFGRGGSISEACENACREVEKWVCAQSPDSALPWLDEELDSESDTFVTRRVFMVVRSSSENTSRMVDHIDSIYDDSQMTDDDMQAYRRAISLPGVRRIPRAIQEQ